MCMLLGVHHSFTWQAMLDVINLINKFFEKDVVQLSKFKLFSYFPEAAEWYKYHIYCSDCKSYIGHRNDLPSIVTCSSCNKIIENIKYAPYFLTLNIKHQLKQLFEDPLVQPYIQYKKFRTKDDTNNIEDIYDGKIYRNLSSSGNILADDRNFSYILNTDGCQAADSSTTTVWPVYMKIVELPPEIRNKHLILAGLWVNAEKPVMNIFLQPFISELNDLSSKGVDWKKIQKKLPQN